MNESPRNLADFTIEFGHGEPVLVVVGELDLSNQDEFLDQLRSVIEAAHSSSVVDLAGVTFFGSSGLSALVQANRDAEQKGVTLVMAAPSPMVRQVLDVTDLSSIFEIRD